MKTSLTLTFLILALGGVFGWQQHERLEAIREIHRQTMVEVRARGISPERLATIGKLPLASRRGREDTVNKTAEAKALAVELIFWKSAAVNGQTGVDSDRIEKIMDQLEDLTPFRSRRLSRKSAPASRLTTLRESISQNSPSAG